MKEICEGAAEVSGGGRECSRQAGEGLTRLDKWLGPYCPLLGTQVVRPGERTHLDPLPQVAVQGPN